jgi:hypothetical protein
MVPIILLSNKLVIKLATIIYQMKLFCWSNKQPRAVEEQKKIDQFQNSDANLT